MRGLGASSSGKSPSIGARTERPRRRSRIGSGRSNSSRRRQWWMATSSTDERWQAAAGSSSSSQQAAAAMATSSTDEGWQAAARSGERRQQAAAAGKAERSFTFNFPLSPSPFTFRPSTFHFALAHFSPLPPSPSPFTFDHAPSPCTMHFPPCTVHLAPFTYSPFTLPCRSGARPRGTSGRCAS